MLALKRLPEKHTLIKLATQTNKRTQILIQTGRGKDNNMCSASASGDTVINKSTLAYMYSLVYKQTTVQPHRNPVISLVCL